MLRKSLVILIAAMFAFLTSACNDNGTEPTFGDLDTGPAFLMVDETDDLNLASDHAFLMDGTGPMFFRVLDLTDDQKAQIRDIAGSYRDDFRALHQQWREGGASWEEIRDQRQALRTEMHNAIINTVLTADQQAIVQQIQADLASGVYPQILVDHRVAKYTDLLGLTTDQQSLFTDLIAQFGQQMLEARNNSTDREALRATMKALFEELDTQITAILTADQLAIYTEWKAERERRRPGHFRGGRPGGKG